MPCSRLSLLAAIALATCLAEPVAAADTPPATADQAEFFEKHVRPVLAASCLRCHGPEKQKGSLRLDSRAAVLAGGETGPAVVPGQPEKSLLISAIRHAESVQMPPTGKLPDQDVAALVTWVRMGVPWPKAAQEIRPPASGTQITAQDRAFWSFQPIQDPPPPAVRDTAWPRMPLDRFVLAELEAKGLRPVEPADRRTLLRRVTFDLIGLPPTPEEMEAFLRDDSPEAFARVVDRLLASPHYGERWARHWLDVARYGEDQAHTFQARLYPHGYRYRDWVVRAFNTDLPYDRFIREQIAGDLLDGPDRQGRLAAVGFFALGPVYYGKAFADELDDRVDTLCRGFLGLTVACARCHDHKFDPIPTRDYYSLAGIFSSTQYKEYPPEDAAGLYAQAQAALRAREDEATRLYEAEVVRLLVGRGGLLALPKNLLEKALPGAAQKKLTALRAEADRLKKDLAKLPVIHSLTEAPEPGNLRVYIRGNQATPGEEAPRRFLAILSPGEPPPFTKGSGRLELADAIASRNNPLTARVFVNRVWHHLFGRGLVATPSNFGALGERPTHPALLDHLASRFLAEGWSIKKLTREILLSATYQLSSRGDAKNEQVDPENRLLWRANRRRLEVEAWRDALLAVTGSLDRTLGGPSVNLAAPENNRRTLYAAVSRHNLDGLLRLFDFPDPNLTVERRPITTVPLQQLFVLNSEFMVRQARALAARVAATPDADDVVRIRRAFLLVYGRAPTDLELRLGLDFLADAPAAASLSAWEQYAQVLLSANEFAYLD